PGPNLNLSCFPPGLILAPAGQPGSSTNCIVTDVTHCQSTVNIVTANGTGATSGGGGGTVTSTDTNNVTVLPISIACQVLVSINNGASFFAPSVCATQAVGSSYIIRVVVTNTGSYALQNVNITSATDLTSCLPRTGLTLAVNGSITIDCTNTCAA